MTDNKKIEALEKYNFQRLEVIRGITVKDILVIINRLKSENEDLLYKLSGVMHSVDKWLDGDELEADEVQRACIMRERTLEISEKQQAEIERCLHSIKLLEKDVADASAELKRFKKMYVDEVGAVAIKAFVKKFEKKIKDVEFTLGQTWEIQNALKDTLKEMVGDGSVEK